MIHLIDTVPCDALEKCIVKPEALKKVVLVQDAGHKDLLFALLMVDGTRAVLVPQGRMSLEAVGGVGMLKLQLFRNQLDKAGVTARELRFCAPGTYSERVDGRVQFDPQWFVASTFPDLAERFVGWRAGRAIW